MPPTQGGARAGQKAVVFGAGCIGLVCMMALKAEGVSEIIVVDVMAKRLEKAMTLGATATINAAEEDTVERIKELTGGEGIDLSIETAGTEITTRQAIEVARKRLHYSAVGYSKTGELTLPISLFIDKELTFRSVFRYRHIYPMAIEAVAKGRVNLKDIATHIFGPQRDTGSHGPQRKRQSQHREGCRKD